MGRGHFGVRNPRPGTRRPRAGCIAGPGPTEGPACAAA